MLRHCEREKSRRTCAHPAHDRWLRAYVRVIHETEFVHPNRDRTAAAA